MAVVKGLRCPMIARLENDDGTIDAPTKDRLPRMASAKFMMSLDVLVLASSVLMIANGGAAMAESGRDSSAPIRDRPACPGDFHNEATPRFRALSSCRAAKAGPDQDRLYRPFHSIAGSMWRLYDGPVLGTPREYELPGTWKDFTMILCSISEIW
jgi:hypothetical protein